jgi:hypothetical protein
MGIISTQSFTFRLIANGTQLDTFKDEDILISNNVTGLFDIGVLPADFTRQITLPGSKVNNAFFEHVYDISIDNPFLFATNIKVPAYVDFDSIYLIQGYIQLNKVNLLANKFVESYEITLYGSLSSFARDINRNFLTDLTSLTKYNHTASYNAITSSWTGDLFNGDIVYPLADYGSGYEYTQGSLQTFGMNTRDGALTVQNFKPAIRVKAVLDAIFEGAGYTYTSSFIGSGVLDDVYMNCNYALKYPEFSGVDLEGYGKIKVGVISGSTDTLLPSDTFVTLPFSNALSDPQGFYNNGAYRIEKETNLQGILNLNVNVSCSVNNMPGTFTANGTWQIRMIETGSSTPYSLRALQSYIVFFDQLQQSRTGGINTTYELQTQFKLETIPAGNYYFQVKQRPNFPSPTEQPKVTLDPAITTKSYIQITQVNQAADGRVMDIPSNMPYGTNGIKQIDFILGLQKKYNLVIYPNKIKPNQFIIETFNDWYNKGNVKDFNRYINLDKTIEVIPANNFAVNKLNFGDTLDNDYVSQQFNKEANREFGKSYYVDTTNFFSQGTFEVKTTFASDPLVRIAGTGLSGSVGGFSPPITQYQVGYLRMSNKPAGSETCSSFTTLPFYTSNGTVTTGLIAYFDPYGNTPITGFSSFLDLSLQAWEINSFTGQIGYSSGYFC